MGMQLVNKTGGNLPPFGNNWNADIHNVNMSLNPIANEITNMEN